MELANKDEYNDRGVSVEELLNLIYSITCPFTEISDLVNDRLLTDNAYKRGELSKSDIEREVFESYKDRFEKGRVRLVLDYIPEDFDQVVCELCDELPEGIFRGRLRIISVYDPNILGICLDETGNIRVCINDTSKEDVGIFSFDSIVLHFLQAHNSCMGIKQTYFTENVVQRDTVCIDTGGLYEFIKECKGDIDITDEFPFAYDSAVEYINLN